MIDSVLIANRGEIACRVIRTARQMGLRTIAVYSDADRSARHVREADEAYPIGPAAAAESYLDAAKVIAVAKECKAAAIHPGYGFLSENAAFAKACADAGIVFIGPGPQAIEKMGQKDRAKALMEAAGVPVVPGYHGENQDPAFLHDQAREIGYPVLIKAVSGGGGKGMRLVERDEDFPAALESAQREGQNAFGDPNVLIERFVKNPRHIEIQVFADSHGQAVHLYERDCSLQRRHQKVIEEAPAPGMTPALREAMGSAAVKAALAVGYQGAGTVEFIVDGSNGLSVDGFFFMEMNTRLQVEHPVTEAITGQDLVAWQLDIANGKRLPLAQSDIPLMGHAVEARLYAEDPENGFLPSTGRLYALFFADGEGVRIDSGVEAGDDISPYYDPMIAKVIVHADSRDAAMAKLADVLRQSAVVGPKTNAAFLAQLASHPDFLAQAFDTSFIDARLETLIAPDEGARQRVAASAVRYLFSLSMSSIAAAKSLRSNEEISPWDATDGFQLGAQRCQKVAVVIDGEEQYQSLSFGGDGMVVVGLEGGVNPHVVPVADGLLVVVNGRQYHVKMHDYEHEEEAGSGQIGAPMHGKVTAIFVEAGQAVAKGERLFIVEAMKMEHSVVAPFDGVIAAVAACAGDQVEEGYSVVLFEQEEAA